MQTWGKGGGNESFLYLIVPKGQFCCSKQRFHQWIHTEHRTSVRIIILVAISILFLSLIFCCYLFKKHPLDDLFINQSLHHVQSQCSVNCLSLKQERYYSEILSQLPQFTLHFYSGQNFFFCLRIKKKILTSHWTSQKKSYLKFILEKKLRWLMTSAIVRISASKCTEIYFKYILHNSCIYT